jgi:hypothetical protein
MRSIPNALLLLVLFWSACLVQEDPVDDTFADLEEEDRNLFLAYFIGQAAFEQETFGGNGRTCRTCHDHATGTLTLEAINDRFEDDPDDPLFLWDGTDDFISGNERLLTRGTFLIRRPLPPGVSLANDPGATEVVLARGTPTTKNIALDPVLMLDGREPDLPTQALNAIVGHAQATEMPTMLELLGIEAFQKTPEFFSRLSLLVYAYGGPAPQLPQGITAAQKRGRRFFENVPPDVNTGAGICATCHGGPMLNASNQFNCPGPFPCDPQAPGTIPVGARFTSSLISELNLAGNPIHELEVQTPGGPVVIATPDPGRALETGNWAPFPFGDLHAFKTPTLWGVKSTSPYMHDNSLATLEDVAEHYQDFFVIISQLPGGPPPTFLSQQDLDDMVAFMKLL